MTRHHPLVQAGIRNFITYNPMFVFSALLLLGGAWLVNPPRVDGGRDRLMLFQLFGAVQLYELVLLGAAALLARRRGLERDVRFLSFVLAPFLMDISCTNALAAEQTGTWTAHVVGILAILAMVAGKVWIATRLVGIRFTPSAWAALLAGPAAVTAGPFLASYLAYHGFSASEQALTAGLVLAGLVALWGVARSHDATDAFALRALAPIVLGVATWHALGTVWAHTGSLLHVLGPALIALGPVLPRLAWPHLAATDRWTPLLLPAVGALLCGLPTLDTWGPRVDAPAWHVGLLGLALVSGLQFMRHRSVAPLLGVLLAFDLAAAGSSLGESLQHVGRGRTEPLALLALFAYGLLRRAHPALVLAPLVLAAALIARLRLLGGALDPLLCVDVIGVGLLAWTHRTHGKAPDGLAWRFVGCALLWLPAHVLAARGGPWADTALLFGRGALVGLVALALATRLRAYAVPALLLPLEGLRLAAPTSTAGWGTLGITGAFVAVGLGVLVSLKREAVLAWLDRQPAPEPEEEAAPTPIAVPATHTRSSLIAASVAGALLVPLVAFGASAGKGGHGYPHEAGAIGALKTICTAQSLFREGDEEGDGVLDYARDLRELGRAGLLDPALASGEKHGYSFRMIVSPEHPEFLWMATATPLDRRAGARSFAINHMSVVGYSMRPLPLNADCRLPEAAITVSK